MKNIYVLLEGVREYTYLGIILSLNGSLTNILNDLYQMGQKAFSELKSLFKNTKCTADQLFSCLIHSEACFNVR